MLALHYRPSSKLITFAQPEQTLKLNRLTRRSCIVQMLSAPQHPKSEPSQKCFHNHGGRGCNSRGSLYLIHACLLLSQVYTRINIIENNYWTSQKKTYITCYSVNSKKNVAKNPLTATRALTCVGPICIDSQSIYRLGSISNQLDQTRTKASKSPTVNLDIGREYSTSIRCKKSNN